MNDSVTQTFIERRNRNLAFFASHYPTVYERIEKVSLQTIKLNINELGAETDILYGPQSSRYGGDAERYAQNEVTQFLSQHVAGSLIEAHSCFQAKHYGVPRYYFNAIRTYLESVEQSGITGSVFHRPEALPGVVILGAGLGYHVIDLLQRRPVLDCMVVEPNLEVFAASLYCADWFLLAERVQDSASRVTFFVGEHDHPEVMVAVVWNQLIQRSPIYPLMTAFYNHGNTAEHNECIDKLIGRSELLLASWGNYDDELNQINQGFLNLSQNTSGLIEFKSRVIDVPICIVGSAPSLDARIERLKALADRVVIVSCGSSITALYGHGIKPDFHVELESDYMITSDLYGAIDDRQFLSSIPIFGPAHLNPHLLNYFSEQHLFFKAESTMSGVMDCPNSTVSDGMPTCTNLAIALAIRLGFKTIFLVGMDLGYQIDGLHHSEKSVYYDEQAADYIQNTAEFHRQHSKVMTSLTGEPLRVPYILESARFKLEQLLIDNHRASLNVYNCSDGLPIKGAQWVTAAQFQQQVIIAEEMCQKKATLLNELLHDGGAKSKGMGQGKTIASIEDKKLGVINRLECWVARVVTLIDTMDTSHESVVHGLLAINRLFEYDIKDKVPDIYRLMGGSLRHFSLALYSSFLKCEDYHQKKFIFEQWQFSVNRFLKNTARHAQAVLFNPTLSEQWSRVSLLEVEPGLAEFMMGLDQDY